MPSSPEMVRKHSAGLAMRSRQPKRQRPVASRVHAGSSTPNDLRFVPWPDAARDDFATVPACCQIALASPASSFGSSNIRADTIRRPIQRSSANTADRLKLRATLRHGARGAATLTHGPFQRFVKRHSISPARRPRPRCHKYLRRRLQQSPKSPHSELAQRVWGP